MQEFKAKDKITQKMTRDGVVETNLATGEQTRKSQRETDDFSGDAAGTLTGKALDRAALEAGRHKAKKRRRKAKKAAKQADNTIKRETSPLQFSEEEQADPELLRYIRKSEKAADKLGAAQSKIPKQKRLKTARKFDEATGRAKVRLYFEETDKPPSGKLRHNPADRPIREVTAAVHGKIHEVEKENSGVEGTHKAEKLAEQAGGYAKRKLKEGYRSHKLKPYRNAAKAEAAAQKANATYLYRKALQEHPEIGSNPLSRFHQKQKIKRQYTKDLRRQAKAAGKAADTAKSTRKMAQQAGNATRKTTDFIIRHWKAILTVGAFLLLLVMIFTGLSSCSAMLQGGVSSILGTSYTAEDRDIQDVENDYKAKETELKNKIDRIERDYPGYDEYRYHLDEIGHDPFALASYLTAKLYDYTREEAQAEMQALFELQYTLTLREEIEIRYRTETSTDADGNTTSEEVPYEYYILHVTLTNKNLTALAGELLTPEQKEMFDTYMETKGNKPDVFGENIYTPSGNGEYTDYEIPPEALSDEHFAAMIGEAEKYLGYPYVWGGSSPSTSFDCSGFVCWVINKSGVGSIGRTTAQGIFNYTTPIAPSEAKPGDIIFFTGTYDSGSAVSHVGIYAGNGMMIHCGNPISYASVNSSYWQQHFYAYGRLP
ncbi:C40 family peptidase [Eubacterium sp. 1001713B170207_170306_E7]|uniref:C40 family peptidase n=1 Tax=Eubacterium sp. 1001713B170207_170306_E7 TaxID=2787097 RepID=UPI001896E2F4|nr:C40 family peptidase [Eubacterium sp. 1001713B170207_170306_E7]